MSYLKELWIVVPNWRRFQHYDPDQRTPPWIKTYLRLMSDENYLGLTGQQRAILHGLWLEYASSTCRLRADTLSLTRRLNLRVTTAQLEALNHAGFIEFSASKPLAPRYQDASGSRAGREVEVEKNEDLTNVRKEASYVARENRGDDNLSKIDYEQLLRQVTGGA